MTTTSMIDLERFSATPLDPDPFDHVIIPGFIRKDVLDAVNRDYPEVEKPGSFPLGELTSGPAFTALMHQIQGPAMTAAFAAKFGMDLQDRPTMVTVRGQAREKDGQIHTDSTTKLITVLIYMNPAWESSEGRLRLLRSPDSLDAMVREVPPEEGTMLAFRTGLPQQPDRMARPYQLQRAAPGHSIELGHRQRRRDAGTVPPFAVGEAEAAEPVRLS